ncbi:MAG TPA: hypothetical protein VGC76_13145 [Pyrinomonadaceae bacterium]
MQAISLIEKTAEEAVFWEDKKTAVEVMAEAADLLWEENQTISTKWLVKAWKITDEVSDLPKNEKMAQFFSYSDKTGLRTIILRVAQKYDAALAENFLKQLAEKDSDEKKAKGAFDDKTARSEQLLRLAQQAVENNPNLAFTLAERSLADGISYNLQNVLTDLRKKDANLANRLFDLALARFKNSPPDTSEAQILAGYLFKSGFTFGTNSGGETILVVNPNQQNLPAVAQSEPIRTRNFLSAVYQSFFTRPILPDTDENKKKAADILVLGNSVAGYYERFASELAQPTRVFLAQLQILLYPNRQNQTSESGDGLDSLPKNATKEEIYDALISYLEEKADKESDAIAKKIAYIKAAVSTKAEDYKRGVKIAEKIDDENLREDAVSFLLYRAALYFVQKKEIETAEELAPQINETLRRAVVKIGIAQFLLQPKIDKKAVQAETDFDRQRAFGLLSDAERDLKKEDSSANLVKIFFGKTSVLAKFDKTQALVSLEETIQKINKIENFNLKDASAPALGLDVSSASSATVFAPRVGFGFQDAIEPLIETDFEQAASIVERLAAKEMRGVGRIEIAKLFFQKNNKLLSQK